MVRLTRTQDSESSRFAKEHVDPLVYDMVRGAGGSISAEHGIGQLKTSHLRHTKDAVELDLMRLIKNAFDPGNILNPGKLLEDPRRE
jgi:FAD/FMN-containing dehydrogenase